MQLKQGYEKEGYCGVARTGPGVAGTRKQERKKTSRLTMVHSNGYYVKVSSASSANVQESVFTAYLQDSAL